MTFFIILYILFGFSNTQNLELFLIAKNFFPLSQPTRIFLNFSMFKEFFSFDSNRQINKIFSLLSNLFVGLLFFDHSNFDFSFITNEKKIRVILFKFEFLLFWESLFWNFFFASFLIIKNLLVHSIYLVVLLNVWQKKRVKNFQYNFI